MKIKYFRVLEMSSDEESYKTCQMLDLKADEVKLLDPFRYCYYLYARPNFISSSKSIKLEQ